VQQAPRRADGWSSPAFVLSPLGVLCAEGEASKQSLLTCRRRLPSRAIWCIARDHFNAFRFADLPAPRLRRQDETREGRGMKGEHDLEVFYACPKSMVRSFIVYEKQIRRMQNSDRNLSLLPLFRRFHGRSGKDVETNNAV
jgi:hypothetical protein